MPGVQRHQGYFASVKKPTLMQMCVDHLSRKAQVRERMQLAQEALHRLRLQGTSAPQAAPTMHLPAAAAAAATVDDDETCIACLDWPACVTLTPCNYCTTCTSCAELVMKAKQPCPLCRTPVIGFKQWEQSCAMSL